MPLCNKFLTSNIEGDPTRHPTRRGLRSMRSPPAWVQAILDGVKTIEVRPKNPTKRSIVYLMASGTDEVCGSIHILSSDRIADEGEWTSLAPYRRVPSDDDKSTVALARRRLLVLRNDTDTPFPKHTIPHDFVAFLRAHTHVPAAYAATAAVAIVRAGLGGQFALECARAALAMIACVLRILHFHAPQSMMSI